MNERINQCGFTGCRRRVADKIADRCEDHAEHTEPEPETARWRPFSS
ncbi:hypothetical protein [Streptosporangium lutulentum]|uniref:DUF1059 domain-containing protein n=1 Tax=Streptosporangium lutulentum TaxID=1461250 RepID=A0ABT9QLD4_9ACTN|nr:hypothetical protein [Streptosporangium lutulentum]MDP9847555.1 hypothetical protein [Streptosporangium lutulentum]